MIDVTAFKTCFVAVTLKYANIKLSTVCCQHILSLSLSVVEIEMVEVLRDCNLQHHFCFNFVVEIFRDSISRPQGTKVGERFMNSYPTFLINFSDNSIISEAENWWSVSPVLLWLKTFWLMSVELTSEVQGLTNLEWWGPGTWWGETGCHIKTLFIMRRGWHIITHIRL